MNQNSGGLSCAMTCWGVAALGGLLVAILLVLLAGFKIPGGLFFGFLTCVIGGFALTWAFCRGLPAPNTESMPQAETVQTAAATAPAPAAAVMPEPTPAPEPEAEPEPAPEPEPEPEPVPEPVAKKAEPAPKPQEKRVVKPVSADGMPELLKAARPGGPDDLKMIKGVGPQMESMLHGMGIFHFDQVASWRPKEVEWVDGNLPRFKGRVSRDNWVDQAKLLAAGEETEFSKKAKKGGIYDT